MKIQPSTSIIDALRRSSTALLLVGALAAGCGESHPADDAGPGDDASVIDAAPPGPDAWMPDAWISPCDDVDCSDLDDACNTGVCNETTGACEAMPVADATSCDDGSACTTGDACTAGTCAGAAVDCSGSSDTCHAGTCDPATGACTSAALADGTTCDEGCGVGACAAGSCDATATWCAFDAPGALTDTPPIGGGGGTLYEDACPAGQVLIGHRGFLASGASHHGQLQGICGTLRLAGNGPYAIAIDRAGTTEMRGAFGGGPEWEAVCPSNEAIVGVTGRSGLLVDQLTLRCAPLTVSWTATGVVLGTGTVTDLAPAGGAGGSPAPGGDCPSGQVAVESRIRGGDSIDAFGLGCAQPVLEASYAQLRDACAADATIVDAHAGPSCHDVSTDAAASASWIDVPADLAVTLYAGAGCTGTSRTISASAALCDATYGDGSAVMGRVGSYRIAY